MLPLSGLDADLQRSLLAQVRDLWTHGSTALEGNTLTLGETKFVIEVRERKRYIDTLASYQLTVGPLTRNTGPWPRPDLETPFVDLCRDAYASTRALIAAAQAQQALRIARSQTKEDAQ